MLLYNLDLIIVIYLGISQSLVNRLQLIQNGARLLTGRRRRDRITKILASLHWLPVRYQIDFKAFVIMFKIWNSLAPLYLSDFVTLHKPVKNLRFAGKQLLQVPQSWLKRRGDRDFSIAGPLLWNNLAIRAASSVFAFKTALKKHFYFMVFQSELGKT